MKFARFSTLGVGSTLVLAGALLSACGDDSSDDANDDKVEKDSGGGAESTAEASEESEGDSETTSDVESSETGESSESSTETASESPNDAGHGEGLEDGGSSEQGDAATSDEGTAAMVEDGGELASDSGPSSDASSEEPDEDALYALVARVYGEEADQSYVLLTDNLNAGSLDLADAVIEVPGLALGTGIDESGALFVASDSASTVTRYDLSDDGELVEGDTVDFSVQGVAYVGEYGGQFQYVSPDKAYWFSGEASRIIVWNPEDMTISDAIELNSLVHEGEALTFSAAPVRRGNHIYTFAAWHTPPPALTIVSRTAVIDVNTETDEVEVIEDTRCGYVRDGVFGEDDQLYMVTEGLGAAVNYFNADNAPAPCVLRFNPELGEFDEDYNFELNSLFDGDPAGMLVLSGSGEAFVRYLDPSLVPDAESPMEVAGSPAWGWAKFVPGETPTVELLEAPMSSGRLTPVKAGGKVYVPQFIDGESTVFTQLTDGGPTTDALEVPGLVFSAVKLR